MNSRDFTATILVDKTPIETFKAINNVRGWWSEEIEGNTEKLNDVFNYHFEDIHRCQIKLIEVVPGKRIVWHVLDNYFKPGIFEDASRPSHNTRSLVHEKAEWIDTRISFEISEKDGKTLIRFIHLGLVPEYECFSACSNGWSHYIQQSLFKLIMTGEGEPNSTGKPKTSDEKKLATKA
jgi:hypothetical protein